MRLQCFCSSKRTARTIAAMSRPRATSRKLRRVQVLLALFLACGPEPKTGALNSVRGVPEQRQANNADGAGFPWSGGRAVSKVGCDVWHGTPKILKPERGRLLREFGHATCSLHAGLRWEAETQRSSVLSLCPVRPKTRKTSRRKGFVAAWLCCSDAFPSLL